MAAGHASCKALSIYDVFMYLQLGKGHPSKFTFLFDHIKKKVTPTSACQVKDSWSQSWYKAATYFHRMCWKD